jgi:hypothetical protein
MSLPSAEQSDAGLLALMKDGRSVALSGISGGGMIVGDDPDQAYEVHATDHYGKPITLFQGEIAAVVRVDTLQQVEFGNPLVASALGHPRGAQ